MRDTSLAKSKLHNSESEIQNPLRILVMGAGSIGSAIGAFMGKGGHEVTLVSLDQAHLEAIGEKGLRITGIWGEHVVRGLRTRSDLEGLRPGDFDLILVSVKSYDTAMATASIRPLVDEATLVCSYQNGLGNAERIAEAVGWERTIGARVIYGVRLPEPGCAEITVIAAPTALGVYSADAPADRVRAIAAAMNATGNPTEYTDAVATLLWAKVAYNCALNPLSALLDVPYGVLVETDHTLDIIREIIAELYAVADAMEVPMDPVTAEGYMEVFLKKLLPPTAAHYASMREDFVHRRRTEIDALNGCICRYGQAHGVPCPTNAFLTRLVRAREHALGVRY